MGHPVTRASTQEHRQRNIDGTSNMPGWWTPVRRAVMEALLARSEIKVRMRHGKVGVKTPSRWRPHAPGMKTRHLFMGERPDSPLTAENVGPAIKSLIDWGYIYKLSTSVPQVMFSPKGWAWLAAEKLIEPAWIDMIFDPDDYPTDRNTTWELYRKMRNTRDAQENVGMAQEEPKPQAEDDLPLLPRYDDQVEGILAERAKDGDQVARITLQLARDFHNKTSPALGNVEPQKIAEAIREHFTPEEVVRADLELARREGGGSDDTFFSRLLVSRMSAAGQFKRHSLADHLGHGGVRHPGIARGVERISVALEMEELREEGLARHLPPETTLGDVHERLQRESIVGVGLDQYSRADAIADIISHENDWRRALAIARDEAQTQDDHDYWQHQLNVLDKIIGALEVPVPATPENIEAASAAAKAEDDALPMVDWIEKRLGQYDYDGMVESGNAALVAREAVLRHMRQNPAGARVVGEGLVTQYDGFRLHVRRNIAGPDGRTATVTLSIDSDYDERDTANVEGWFERLIAADEDSISEREIANVRSVNPLWMIAMSFGSALAALILFVVLLSFLPLNPRG
jgi:hypothetical protein